MAKYKKIHIPDDGEKIHVENGLLVVPDNPIIGFIEGDGTGPDICKPYVIWNLISIFSVILGFLCLRSSVFS